MAASSGRPAQQIVEEALERFFEDQGDLAASIEEACAAIDAGEYLGHEEVVERIERRFRS